MDSYNSPYQPKLDKQQFTKMGMDAGRNILQNAIIWGNEILKFVIQFIIDGIKQVFGR